MEDEISPVEVDFLRESNAIEGVYDEESLLLAAKAWKYMKKQETLSFDALLKAHDILMEEHLPAHERGHLRTRDVFVGGRKGAAPELLDELVQNWVNEANENIESEKNLHIDFELIHPFIDGNGRIGRMLYNWQRLKNGKEIEVIKESSKQEYYKWFR